MGLEKTDRILTILASIATIIGAVFGIYFLFLKEKSPANPTVTSSGSTTQQVAESKTQQIVVSKTTTGLVTGNSGSNVNTTTSQTITKAPPKNNVYFEDFSTVKEGNLPVDWEGDDSIVVMKSGDRPRLVTNATKGTRPVTMKRFAPTKNFCNRSPVRELAFRKFQPFSIIR
ncbi:MAG: hypothetical protein R3B84_21950 [Zavarzinella sp.]